MPRTIATWTALLEPSAAPLLAEVAACDGHDAAAIMRLRKRYPPAMVTAALDLSQARAKANAKYPSELAASLVADCEGVEQATPAIAADHKAERFQAAIGDRALVDLCSGIGGDAMSMVRAGLNVRAADRDPLRAWMTQHNAGCPTETVDVTTLLPLPAGEVFHFDPARRAANRRVWTLANYQPGPAFLAELLEGSPTGAVKLGPGVKIDELPAGEVEFVSVGGKLSQAVLWTGELARHPRTATCLPRGDSITGWPAFPEAGDARRYVHTVDPAVERAELVHVLCEQLQAPAIHAKLGLLTSDSPIASPWVTSFELLDDLPWRVKRVKAALASLGAGVVEVKTRDRVVDPDKVQGQLRGKGDARLTVFVLRFDRQAARDDRQAGGVRAGRSGPEDRSGFLGCGGRDGVREYHGAAMDELDRQLALLCDGTEAVYSVEELKRKLASGKQLLIKLGMDPTAPDIHLGHSVVLRKMRQFQDLGHKGVLIIGDYTARIGDPTGRDTTRPVLSEEAIKANAKTYFEQAGHILDLSPNKLEVRSNSEWLASLSFADVLRLTGQITVQQMLHRENFKKRMGDDREIMVSEFMYPLMQAYDSVVLESDVELGGTDQTFNCLMGRALMEKHDQEKQVVIVMPILVGLDGHEKMSKSKGNYVGLTDAPDDMFGKVMSIPDELMHAYFELVTDVPDERVGSLVDSATTHPREAKDVLARVIVEAFHDLQAANAASEEFRRRFAEKQLPTDLDVKQASAKTLGILKLMVEVGFASSNSEARRLVTQGAVTFAGEKVTDPQTQVTIDGEPVLQVGKRRVCQVTV